MGMWFCRCSVIYIGKDTEGRVMYVTNYAKLLEGISNKIYNIMGIIGGINLLEEAAKQYIGIKVNPYSVPVSLKR